LLSVLVMSIDYHVTNGKGIKMNWSQIEGNWKQSKGNVKQQWGKLTDDQIDVIAGKREQLVGKIQGVYGKAVDEVEKELTEWQNMQKDNNIALKKLKVISHEQSYF
jgi:uncharacterized protein YjbJ (UPF0337 family)